MASDILRARIAAAIWARQNPGRSYADETPRWRADAEADADAVMAVVGPELERLRHQLDDANSELYQLRIAAAREALNETNIEESR